MAMSGAALTGHLDLRGGRPCWQGAPDGPPGSDPLPRETVDLAIVGAGVMGAMLAERLGADGRTVAVLDRRPPAYGSTAASTALVMWAADTPLTELSGSIGGPVAARRWRRVAQAVLDLDRLVAARGLACGWRARPELYLAGDRLDAAGLRREADIRQRAGLSSVFAGAADVAARFGISARPALLSSGVFEVDPVALTLELLRVARARNVSLTFPADVVSVERRGDAIELTTAEGRSLRARQAVLATGYEAPRPALPAAFGLSSSYAIATRPGVAPFWRENALIWEAADPYLYARATTDGRLIFGGEDEAFAEASRRDALIAQKRATLETLASRLLGGAPIVADCAWSATFGTSPDGHPAIGRSREIDGLWLAYGFGGNGVTFASLAAGLIAADMAGEPEPGAADFSPHRFG